MCTLRRLFLFLFCPNSPFLLSINTGGKSYRQRRTAWLPACPECRFTPWSVRRVPPLPCVLIQSQTAGDWRGKLILSEPQGLTCNLCLPVYRMSGMANYSLLDPAKRSWNMKAGLLIKDASPWLFSIVIISKQCPSHWSGFIIYLFIYLFSCTVGICLWILLYKACAAQNCSLRMFLCKSANAFLFFLALWTASVIENLLWPYKPDPRSLCRWRQLFDVLLWPDVCQNVSLLLYNWTGKTDPFSHFLTPSLCSQALTLILTQTTPIERKLLAEGKLTATVTLIGMDLYYSIYFFFGRFEQGINHCLFPPDDQN